MSENINMLDGKKVGFALCGSFCTFDEAISVVERLINLGCIVTPIMSSNAYNMNTKFGKAQTHIDKLEKITDKKVIHEIVDAEPIGPQKMFDILIVAPCTGNTLAKLALGITDTPVTMAVKSHIRNGRPVVLAVSTNDALAGSSKNIGALQNYKNFYFVPMHQDDSLNKPNSLIASFDKIPDTLICALDHKQIQPIL